MQIGQRVEITGPGDETFDKSFIGLRGTISSIDTGSEGRTIGQSASDPFYEVDFDNGLIGNFWNEEMKNNI